MKRVVITGLGIVSSIGKNKKDVLFSLKKGISGITFSKKLRNLGIRSHVWGKIKINKKYFPSRKILRFMNRASVYAYLSMKQAISDAKIVFSQISHERTGLIVGSSIVSSLNWNGVHKMHEKLKKNPYAIIQTMSSGISACLSTFFKIRGISYSINSACSTSAHCIGHAMELIQYGKQDLVFAGGGEELSHEIMYKFDSMSAISTRYNHNPKQASRVYDIHRDGFVASEGSGIVLLEELQHALKRKARIYCEIVGYGATSDGCSMILPCGNGAVRCMKMAMNSVNGSIDYINVHGTSTPLGDIQELLSIHRVFKKKVPLLSATKSMTGHSLGAAGVQEVIYTILMMKNSFIAPSINIDTIDPKAKNMNIIEIFTPKTLNIAMTNSFGFGGTNATLVLEKFNPTMDKTRILQKT